MDVEDFQNDKDFFLLLIDKISSDESEEREIHVSMRHVSKGNGDMDEEWIEVMEAWLHNLWVSVDLEEENPPAKRTRLSANGRTGEGGYLDIYSDDLTRHRLTPTDKVGYPILLFRYRIKFHPCLSCD